MPALTYYLRKLASGEIAFDESVRRAAQYKEAGADSIFVPALVDCEVIGRMVPLVGLPFNALAWAGLPDAARLRKSRCAQIERGSRSGKSSLRPDLPPHQSLSLGR